MNADEKIEHLTTALTGIYWVISESGLDWQDKKYADVLTKISVALELTGQRPCWLK